MSLIHALSIKARLSLILAVSLAGLLLTAGMGVGQMSRFSQRVDADLASLNRNTAVILRIQAAHVDFKTQVQEWKNILLRGNDVDAFKKYKAQFESQADRVHEHLAAVRDRLQATDSPHLATVNALLVSHQTMKEQYLAALSQFDPADPEAGKVVDRKVKGLDREATEAMNALASQLEQEATQGMALITEDVEASYVASRNGLIGTVLVLAFLLAIIALATARHIHFSITRLRAAIAEAQQRLDLSVRVPVQGRDELTETGLAINALFGELQDVVRGMRRHAEAVDRASTTLSHSVVDVSGAVDRQNEATSSMAAATEQLAVSVAHVSDSAGTAHEVSRSSSGLSEQGSQVIARTVSAMSSASTDVQSTAAGIETLAQRVQSIGQIASVIREIADQTNLLALNAAIEAARAGEQGRGFAVVADEVRKLAERTGGATTEIAETIASIRADAERAVGDMRGVVTRFDTLAESTREAGTYMGNIRSGANRVMAVTEEISAALRQQSAASDSIAKHIEIIAAMSESNLAAMSSLNDASQSMQNLARAVNGELARFVV